MVTATATIGASEVAAILGLSPWDTPYTIWARKTGRLAGAEPNEAMVLGQQLEPIVMGWARQQLGDIRPGDDCPIPDTPIVCHPDGITLHNHPVEAKTAGIIAPLRGAWGPAGTDEVPDHYLVQVLVQMAALRAETGHLAALLGGLGYRLYHITDPRGLRHEIVERVCDWWERHVVRDTPPCVQPQDLACLRRIRRQAMRIAIDQELVDAWLAAKDALRRVQLDVDRTEAALLAALGDADEGECQKGLVTYKEYHRKEYTVRASTYRRLLFKEWSDE